MSWGTDCKNTKQGLEANIKMNYCILNTKTCCSYIFIIAKCKNGSNQQENVG